MKSRLLLTLILLFLVSPVFAEITNIDSIYSGSTSMKSATYNGNSWSTGSYIGVSSTKLASTWDSSGTRRTAYATTGQLNYNYGTGTNPIVDTGTFDYVSIVLDNSGNARISYYDTVNKRLKYNQCNTGSTTCATPVVVDAGDGSLIDNAGVGYQSSIGYDNVNNKIFIAYTSGVPGSGTSRIKMAEQDSSSPSGWYVRPLTYGGNTITGYNPSLAVTGAGYLEVAYVSYDASPNQIKYMFPQPFQASVQTRNNVVTSAPANTPYLKLLVTGGSKKRYIAFQDSSGGLQLYFDDYTNNWFSCAITGASPTYISLFVDGNIIPNVIYISGTSLKHSYLDYPYWDSVGRTCRWFTTSVDSSALGGSTSIKMTTGNMNPPSSISTSSATTNSMSVSIVDNSNDEKSWTISGGASTFTMGRGTSDPRGKGNTYSTTAGGLSVNTQYTFSVVTNGGNGRTSSSISGGTRYTLANSPNSFSFSSTSSSITFNWGANGNPSGTSYEVQSCDSSYNNCNIMSVSGTSTTVSAGANEQHCFKIQAVNGDGLGTGLQQAGCKATKPNAISGLYLSLRTTGELTWNWNSMPSGVSARVNFDGSTTTVSNNFFDKTGLSANTQHSISITTANSYGESNSNVVSDSHYTAIEAPTGIYIASRNNPYELGVGVSGSFSRLGVGSACVIVNGNCYTSAPSNAIFSGLSPNSYNCFNAYAQNSEGVPSGGSDICTYTNSLNPSNPSVQVGVTSAALSWGSYGDTEYQVQDCDISANTCSTSEWQQMSSYDFSGLQVNHQYSFYVKSRNHDVSYTGGFVSGGSHYTMTNPPTGLNVAIPGLLPNTTGTQDQILNTILFMQHKECTDIHQNQDGSFSGKVGVKFFNDKTGNNFDFCVQFSTINGTTLSHVPAKVENYNNDFYVDFCDVSVDPHAGNIFTTTNCSRSEPGILNLTTSLANSTNNTASSLLTSVSNSCGSADTSKGLYVPYQDFYTSQINGDNNTNNTCGSLIFYNQSANEISLLDDTLDIAFGNDNNYHRNQFGRNNLRGIDGHNSYPNIVIDIGGDDTYSCSDNPNTTIYNEGDYCQGSANAQLSVVYDVTGNDNYIAKDHSQGFGSQGGVGILVDTGGTNTFYCSGVECQGVGVFGGTGILYTKSSQDSYFAAGYSQGYGYDIARVLSEGRIPGTGILIDLGGNDYYSCPYGSGCQGQSGFLFDYGGTDTYSEGRKNNNLQASDVSTAALLFLDTDTVTPYTDVPQVYSDRQGTIDTYMDPGDYFQVISPEGKSLVIYYGCDTTTAKYYLSRNIQALQNTNIGELTNIGTIKQCQGDSDILRSSSLTAHVVVSLSGKVISVDGTSADSIATWSNIDTISLLNNTSQLAAVDGTWTFNKAQKLESGTNIVTQYNCNGASKIYYGLTATIKGKTYYDYTNGVCSNSVSSTNIWNWHLSDGSYCIRWEGPWWNQYCVRYVNYVARPIPNTQDVSQNANIPKEEDPTKVKFFNAPRIFSYSHINDPSTYTSQGSVGHMFTPEYPTILKGVGVQVDSTNLYYIRNYGYNYNVTWVVYEGQLDLSKIDNVDNVNNLSGEYAHEYLYSNGYAEQNNAGYILSYSDTKDPYCTIDPYRISTSNLPNDPNFCNTQYSQYSSYPYFKAISVTKGFVIKDNNYIYAPKDLNVPMIPGKQYIIMAYNTGSNYFQFSKSNSGIQDVDEPLGKFEFNYISNSYIPNVGDDISVGSSTGIYREYCPYYDYYCKTGPYNMIYDFATGDTSNDNTLTSRGLTGFVLKIVDKITGFLTLSSATTNNAKIDFDKVTQAKVAALRTSCKLSPKDCLLQEAQIKGIKIDTTFTKGLSSVNFLDEIKRNALLTGKRYDSKSLALTSRIPTNVQQGAALILSVVNDAIQNENNKHCIGVSERRCLILRYNEAYQVLSAIDVASPVMKVNSVGSQTSIVTSAVNRALGIK